MEMDWENLGFAYRKTNKRYVDNYVGNKWNGGELIADDTITVSESSAVFQYAQTCFEGLKAYQTVSGKIVTFRPMENAKRMVASCERLVMPIYPEDQFVKAVKMVVDANREFVPPYGTNGSLYIRPFMIGSGAVIGVKPSAEYQFRIFTTPVGNYFKGGVHPLKVCESKYDRAAPHGTGAIKAGLNYAMSIYPQELAHKNGYDENMYLEPVTRQFVEETGGSNFGFVSKDNALVIPKSSSILPSITRRSLIYVAENYLNLKVEERPVDKKELKEFSEAFLCGTAAVLSPVGQVDTDEGTFTFTTSEGGYGPISKKLFDTLRGIQLGTIEAPEGWIVEC